MPTVQPSLRRRNSGIRPRGPEQRFDLKRWPLNSREQGSHGGTERPGRLHVLEAPALFLASVPHRGSSPPLDDEGTLPGRAAIAPSDDCGLPLPPLIPWASCTARWASGRLATVPRNWITPWRSLDCNLPAVHLLVSIERHLHLVG